MDALRQWEELDSQHTTALVALGYSQSSWNATNEDDGTTLSNVFIAGAIMIPLCIFVGVCFANKSSTASQGTVHQPQPAIGTPSGGPITTFTVAPHQPVMATAAIPTALPMNNYPIAVPAHEAVAHSVPYLDNPNDPSISQGVVATAVPVNPAPVKTGYY